MIARRLALLLCLYGLFSVAFLTVNARGNWDFVLWFRGTKLLGISLVAVAIAVATVLFQTLTHNRILTPSLMGFDALYALLQTVLVFTLGGFGFSQLSAQTSFFSSFTIMMVASLLLFGSLLGKSVDGRREDIHRLLLTGIIFGVLFRSFSSFLQRLIDPNDFVVAATSAMASFNSINADLLLVSSLMIAAALVATWRMRFDLDVMALGRDAAVNLGVHYKRQVYAMLVIIAALVSVSTALVGPVAFFGLLVSNLTYQLLPTHRHAILLPAASLLSACVLIGGQVVLEQVLNLSTPLSVIVEFLGGLTFLILILKGRNR
ncbi:iron chelate uptake ABC transporter family permease subunit [Cohaesibacter haloalkalitolerans]|uniref:iron chelate uptake ABC transporter family permease subunit n=1 Tax=Cohaesibacter haloalkalitolerans TaxID=1162980 RepID=UPI000E653208|nr:iron chelate uptake ABC transporter family permease subunit [Cohaesibacter haloalkalitolerans]